MPRTCAAFPWRGAARGSLFPPAVGPDSRPLTLSAKAPKPACEPCIFDGRIMMPDGIERVHEQVLEFEAVEARLTCTACTGAMR
jgi:hypothetical protein